MPLHPYLAGDTDLSVRLMVDDKIYGQTPFTKDQHKEGIWEVAAGLQV